MTEAEVRYLTSLDAQKWLDLAAAQRDSLAVARLLRKDLSADLARLVSHEVELRRRGTDKFSLAHRMFFTKVGLEQATDEAVARYKAHRFPADVPVADLCCGIGGDLLALAGSGPTVGVDRNAALARIAQANTQVAGHTANVVVADVERFSVADLAAWHIDPDRRPQVKRTTHVSFHDPGPDVIARLLSECPHGAIKLAPAADIAEARGVPVLWHQAELEWISRKRECRQLVAWFGSLAKCPGQRRATLVLNDIGDHGPIQAESFVGCGGISTPVAPAVGRFVFEPDAAVLAADLTGALAESYKLRAVSGQVAYLTADSQVVTPLLASFEVIELFSYDAAKLKRWLLEHSIGPVEVKKRGVEIDPARVQRELSGEGEESITVLLCPIAKRVTAIVARRT